MPRFFLLAPLFLAIGACSSDTSVFPKNGTVLPNAALRLTPTTTLSFEQAALVGIVGAAAYLVYDPLAPNWNIEERRVNEETYVLALRAKSFRIGGDGEAYQILKRRALSLQQEKGYAGFRILNYSESIESSTPLTHRIGEGTIQLVRTGLLPVPGR